jgi:hypothetical protein
MPHHKAYPFGAEAFFRSKSGPYLFESSGFVVRTSFSFGKAFFRSKREAASIFIHTGYVVNNTDPIGLPESRVIGDRSVIWREVQLTLLSL